MTRIERERSVRLAGGLHDRVIAPLARARDADGAPAYFPLARDPACASYFVAPSIARMSPQDFDFPGAGLVDDMIDRLAALWSGEGELGLTAAVPHLRRIARALEDEAAEDQGSVDILCYTLF